MPTVCSTQSELLSAAHLCGACATRAHTPTSVAVVVGLPAPLVPLSWRYDLTDEEAIELGQRAIYHATYRDAYSGGINNGELAVPGWLCGRAARRCCRL